MTTERKFMDVVYKYSRAMAIEDGILMDISSMYPAEVKDSGMKWHVAMTRTAWKDFVQVHPAAARLHQDELGRCWDILWMLHYAIKRGEIEGSEGVFSFYAVGPKNRKPVLQKLKAVVGPGDQGEPVITIMQPEED